MSQKRCHWILAIIMLTDFQVFFTDERLNFQQNRCKNFHHTDVRWYSCVMPYQTSNKCCFSSSTLWIQMTGRHATVRRQILQSTWLVLGLFDPAIIICGVACSRNQCRGLCVWALSYWKMKNSPSSERNKHFESLCRLNIFNKFCDNVNYRLDVRETLQW